MSSTPGNPIPIRNPFPNNTAVTTTSQPNLIPPPPPPSQQQAPNAPPPSAPGQVMNVGQNPPPPHPPGIQISGGGGGGGGGLLSPATASALEHYRLTQLYQYAMAAERLRVPPGSFMPQIPPGIRPELAPLFYGPYCRIDPRLAGLCRAPEEPKPQFSYIGLIAMAILGSPEKKLVLSDIYQYILDNYPYFRTRGPGWRNSIRHNLSLNDCFIKAGRSANGKGHYWAIHPANVEDFTKGDFRRRKAQRKVRRHMGLAVDDDDSPSPPPTSPPPVWQHPHHPLFHHGGPHPLGNPLGLPGSPPNPGIDLPATLFGLSAAAAASLAGKSPQEPSFHHHAMSSTLFNRKRQFDVASLLAPEKESSGGAISPHSYKSDEHERDQSLSSPSPPPGSESNLKRSKIYKRAVEFGNEHDTTDDDDESIEVTEDDQVASTKHSNQRLRSRLEDCNDDDKKLLQNEEKSGRQCEDSNSSRDVSPHLLSPKEKAGRTPHGKLGQCGTSSNDEEDCKSLTYSLPGRPNLTHFQMQHNMMLSKSHNNNSGNGAAPNQNTENENLGPINQLNCGMMSGQNNMQLSSSLQMLNQQNILNQAAASGGLPPLEILQAHHHLAQQQQQQQQHHSQHSSGGQSLPPHPSHVPFPFGIPGGPQFLQQNPSLASLMLLSSKYRELTMGAAAGMKRPQP